MVSYRSSFQSYHDSNISPATPSLRTLVGFELSSSSLPKLRFLRVLRLEKSNLLNFNIEMPTHVHNLKLLDAEKSWELFSSKALPSYKRSLIHNIHEFEELGRKLVRKCNGLPLALAVLGGYLSKNLTVRARSD